VVTPTAAGKFSGISECPWSSLECELLPLVFDAADTLGLRRLDVKNLKRRDLPCSCNEEGSLIVETTILGATTLSAIWEIVAEKKTLIIIRTTKF
jgi:hypothetical protein